MNNAKKSILKSYNACLLFLLLFTNAAKAQYNSYTPTNFETGPYVSFANINSIANTVFTNNVATVYAVAFDNGSFNTFGNPLRYRIDDGTSFYAGGIAGPSGSYYITNPDIVLGGSCSTNYVAITYTAEETTTHAKDVYLEVYTLTGVGTLSPGLGISNCTAPLPYVFKLSTSGDADSAHLDLINNVNTNCSGLVQADTFVISWQDAACQATTGMYGVRAARSSFSKTAICNPSILTRPITSIGCINPNNIDASSSDVSAFDRAVNGLGSIARFVYKDPAMGTLYSRDVSLQTGFATQVTVDNPGNNIIANPRIEVSENSTSNDYEIVYRYYNGSGNNTFDVKSINATTSQIITSAYSPGLDNHDNFSPVVASLANDNYSVAYSSPGTVDEVLVNFIDRTAGTVTTTSGDPDYYITNKYSGIGQPVAISNDWIVNGSGVQTPSHNYVCWFNPNRNSGEIDCKFTAASSPYYKSVYTTAVANEQVTGTTFTAFPNPATDMLHVNAGSRNPVTYIITDLTGRQVWQGKITGQTFDVNVSGFLPGVYIISFTNKDKSIDRVKFCKTIN